MHMLISFFFSLFDSASILVLTISTFGISLKQNIKKIAVLTFILNCISNLLVYVGLHNYSIFFLVALLYLIFKYLFKENWKFSVLISVTGTISILMIQGLIAYTALVGGLMNENDMQPFTAKGYIVQAITFGIVLLISVYQRKFGEVFYFDFDNVFRKKRNIKSAKPYILASTILGVIFALMYPNFYNSGLDTMFYITLTLTIVSFSILILLSIKRNNDERISAQTQKSFI